ncbi:MAG TPA: YiiD C-terminal domain-containing protein [Arenimonas sp.]
MSELDELNAHYDAMPPVRAMQVRAVHYDGQVLRLRAPLSHNVNDKACAFGGSLVSLMTLAGWGLMTLKLREAGIRAEVYVADSQVRYLAPLYADLEAGARLADDVDWASVLQAWQARGRARAGISAWVSGPDGAVVADLQGRYAALRPA